MNDGENGLDVGAGSNFGDDAAVDFEEVDLRNDGVRKNAVAIFDDRSSSFVAGRFDAKD